ncbi:MAG: galactokinase [Armatimonadetes bacterium]|nr:galactokinase [Armatimonadota bacterium]
MQGFKRRFEQRYGREPAVYRAPGRVNLIGEHTDYNDGFVMPAALDFATWVGIAATGNRALRIYSETMQDEVTIDLDRLPEPGGHWSDYVAGVACVLQNAGYGLEGADVLIWSDVPLGSGLSSSAALEVSCASALLHDQAGPSGRDLARLCQRAENEFVGTRCGIMDQYISCCGKKDHALLLDCRELMHRYLPLPASVRLVVCNTMVRHCLVDGEYNRRRESCEQAVRELQTVLPGITALRDVDSGELGRHGHRLDPVVRRRCRHVITENERVEQSAAALEKGDLEAFGRLMGESHRSLREDYEVSCPELDLMVKLAGEVPGVWGARMTGGGFGGCAVNLVQAESVQEFRERVARGYESSTGKSPEIHVCAASDGVGRLEEGQASRPNS